MKALTASILLSAAVAAGLPASPALAFSLGWFPACNSPQVHSVIKVRFNAAETRRLHDGASILDIDGAHERAVELYGPSPIPRRYCRARALMNHDHKGGYHHLYFRIGERIGLAGVGWNVEFCINGHDAWKVYDGDCRVLKR